MSNKLQKVLSEIDKVKEKIAVQQTRLRELEQQKTELENMEIVGMVRGLDVAPEELAAFINAPRCLVGKRNRSAPPGCWPVALLHLGALCLEVYYSF